MGDEPAAKHRKGIWCIRCNKDLTDDASSRRDYSENNATNWSPFHYLLECIKMTPAEAKMCRGCHNRTQNLYKEMIHFAENMTDATVRSLHTPLSSCEPFNTPSP